MSREVDPERLDVEAFAREGGTQSGRWPLSALPRLAESAVAPDDAAPGSAGTPAAGREVTWSIRGELRSQRGDEPQIWLHLEAATTLPLECQRCLQPVETPVQAQRSFLFVRGEDAAEELDSELDDDVLALTRALDLAELIEDELLLALPIVPRHETCPAPLAAPADPLAEDEEAPHPFAGLAALKRPLN